LSQTFARVTDSRPAFALSRGFTNWGPLTAGVHDDMIKKNVEHIHCTAFTLWQILATVMRIGNISRVFAIVKLLLRRLKIRSQIVVYN